MNLSTSELDLLYDLTRDKHDLVMRGDWIAVKEEISELHLLMHKLLKLQEIVTYQTVGRDAEKKAEPDGRFDFSTAETAKKLKVTESDLRVLRNTYKLRENYHYTTGRSPRPTAIWYDLDRTCFQLHEVTWETFSQPGFDVQANTDRNTARAFERARRGAKK